jgi:cyanobactin maturation PatA/PatG family protease
MNIQCKSDPLRTIRAALKACGEGSSSVSIGVVDGLPDLPHPALVDAKIDVLQTMVPPEMVESDPHGTSICSLIFGRGGQIRGLAPGCSGLVLPLFFRKTKDGQSLPVSQLDLARAISFGIENDVSIINISAGQKSATAEAESHLAQVIQLAAARRVLLVAAAGNDGCACIHLPAAVEFVLSVGALGATGKPLEISNWAEAYRRNGVLAPGENLPVAVPGGDTGAGTGTSFAAAVVSGVAALLLSVARREGYQLDPLDIRQIIIESATPCELEGVGACDRFLAGTNAAAALAMLHRAGAGQTSFAMVQTAGLDLHVGRDAGGRQATVSGRGDLGSLTSVRVMQSLASCPACRHQPARAIRRLKTKPQKRR